MDDLKARLLKERDGAVAEIELLNELLEQRGDYGFGKGDPTVYQWEFNLAKREHYEERLKEIEASLERLAEGVYGVCERCGGAIGEERLEAVPTTSLCIECAQEVAASWMARR